MYTAVFFCFVLFHFNDITHYIFADQCSTNKNVSNDHIVPFIPPHIVRFIYLKWLEQKMFYYRTLVISHTIRHWKWNNVNHTKIGYSPLERTLVVVFFSHTPREKKISFHPKQLVLCYWRVVLRYTLVICLQQKQFFFEILPWTIH